MSGVLKPLLKSTAATGVVPLVHIDHVKRVEKTTVPVGQAGSSTEVFAIAFEMSGDFEEQKTTLWKYASEGARDTELASLETALATVIA